MTAADLNLSIPDMLLRLGVAAVVGLILGLDRELKGIPAGLRTHALVSLSSAAITYSALEIHVQLWTAGDPATDPLRVVQGLAQAIGFIAAGMIFVNRGGGVKNMTSAANLWLATAVGVASGAGQYALVAATTAIGVALLTAVRLFENHAPRKKRDPAPESLD
ncbi:MgtC/SapB family protein [Sphingoaurantiacus capsulatus]|uniref:Protein MgtC n=1 Tax=Sphingoaurantiacus capsulatus TaxID=1771310 RepID=A0ABV7X974_9SPHN